jgi:hypothetical protein
MKKNYLIILGLTIPFFINAQEDLIAIGGNTSGFGGLVSNTEGQVLYSSSSKLSGSYYTFYRATMSKGLQNVTPYNPIDETTYFLPSDTIALAWSRLVKVYKPTRLKAVWISPDAQEYATYFGTWSSDPEALGYLYWDWYLHWSWIKIKNFPPANSIMWGTWTIKMFYEENYLGFWNLDTTMTFQITGSTSVQTSGMRSSLFELSQNYPNPFNTVTNISFSLPFRSFVTLKVFDHIGREVALLVSEELSAGNHLCKWNATGMSSGIYFYRMQTGSFTETKTLVFLK